MAEDFRFVKSTGAGGFMSPPGDAVHVWRVDVHTSNRRNARNTGIYSLDSIVSESWVPAPVRERAAKLLAEAKREPSEMWIRSVYGYWRNMWSPDGVTRDAGKLSVGRPDGAPLDWHGAVMHIRQWFPDHEPREDLIADPGKGYGAFPCTKCGERVQYEARFDALAVVSTRLSGSGITQWSYATECPKGGAHTVD